LFLALLAGVPFSPPPLPVVRQLRAAIWSDLQLNAFIGNGNWPASLWYNAGSGTTPNLHISDLQCDGRDVAQRCSFTLFRDGGPVKVLGEEAPDKLACDATFVRIKDGDGWAVKHIRGAAHTQTTMRCKAVASAS